MSKVPKGTGTRKYTGPFDAAHDCVYFMADGDGEVLYVGSTMNLTARLNGHVSAPWWPNVKGIRYRCYANRALASRAELEYIHKLRPPHNIAGMSGLPRGRPAGIPEDRPRGRRGQGSMRERTPGVWQIRVSASGRILNRTVRGTRKDATKALAELAVNAEKLARRPREQMRYTVRDLYEAWWRSPTIAAPGTSKTANTLRTHDSLVRTWIGPHLGHIPLAKLSARDIEKMVVAQQAKGLKVSSIRRCIATLRLMLRQAMKWDWIDANPLDKTTLDAVRAGHVTPPPTEAVEAVIEASRHITGPHADTLHPLLYILAATGMRKGEACGLQWQDVNWRDGYITIARNVTYTPQSGVHVGPTKNKRSRPVPLEPEQMDVLNGLYQLRSARGDVTPEHWVFGAGDGSQPLSPSALATAYNKARSTVGTKLGMHGFRHWHATGLLNAGMPIKSVQERLGHSHASTTMNIYAHPVEATARVVAKEVAQLMAQITSALPATPRSLPAPAQPPDDGES